jgi:hypothetical protein
MPVLLVTSVCPDGGRLRGGTNDKHQDAMQDAMHPRRQYPTANRADHRSFLRPRIVHGPKFDDKWDECVNAGVMQPAHVVGLDVFFPS